MTASTARTSWDALARAAVGRETQEDAHMVRELLAFSVDGVPYALPVERVREIVRMRAITQVPRVPEEVLGVISLRGEIVQVLDLRRRLGLPIQEPTRTHRIIVLHGDEGEVTGILVDAVTEVMRVAEDDVRPPASGEAEFANALCPRGEEFVGVLNLERVLDLGAG